MIIHTSCNDYTLFSYLSHIEYNLVSTRGKHGTSSLIIYAIIKKMLYELM